MQKIVLLIFTLIISTVCYAKQPCSHKTFVENYHFNLNAQSYKFTSYHCDENENEFFSEPDILEVHGKNINKSLKNVIGIKGMIGIILSKWNNKPTFYYVSTPSDYTQAFIPINIKNNNLMVDCIYINQQLKNYMVTSHSYCGEPQIVADGFGDEGFEHLFPDFYLDGVFYFIYFPETNLYLSNKEFDVFIGKLDDISFYRRYSSIKNYVSNKYTVIMTNQDKEYRFKESQIYLRMASRESAESFIGLDIIDSKGKITFYDKTALAKRLNKSTIKRNIKSYIQHEKVPLYDEPNDSHPTDMYLVQNDFVKIVDVIWNKEELKRSEYPDIWFKVSYKSKDQGEMVKWINGKAFTIW
ncbi:hypothetical protein A9G11_02970 [Gilliamella sp. wkB108]|uniref:hypothetical protein n=1 Tax=Gilliamella sp. wkB108 TaxID=3120256 RepID=UPI00080ED77A|nr:hypothetical protein [Gilliamella apicola]OCG24865.1 hypothetical protein A9G11_02970 [Gilliamella apicola]